MPVVPLIFVTFTLNILSVQGLELALKQLPVKDHYQLSGEQFHALEWNLVLREYMSHTTSMCLPIGQPPMKNASIFPIEF